MHSVEFFLLKPDQAHAVNFLTYFTGPSLHISPARKGEMLKRDKGEVGEIQQSARCSVAVYILLSLWPGLQIRPVRLKGDLANWEWDHTRSRSSQRVVRKIVRPE